MKQPHKAGTRQVQDVGQCSYSHMDDSIKKQGKDTGKLPTDKSLTNVIPAYNVSENSGKKFHRNELDQSKVWVNKEQGNPKDLRQIHGKQNKDDTRMDQQQVYHSNFPRISSNFDRQVPTSNVNIARPERTPSNPQKNDQAKCEVNIHLTTPEITTKQGLPAVLYVKDEIICDLAASCKFTFIGKFSYTMPKVDLIRKNFILQTQ
ncbi:hypothetical protein KY290_024950 [Solanum tuberosum]|uniref:Uncharacterized protein n=1 Tax=Solanum tuberosum TaxID=4113 RepID=A0ABQ7US47_SOLTU|nr:hypothetical protein KY284_023809 [Solanum tuberosum]KAH0754680.1 hypothetical protein KY290_024950 [Solanum tuberosum]